jgi:serine phosphatase RsbU (regulator of sigma subunit)
MRRGRPSANPRRRGGCIEEVTSPQIAVGMLDRTTFSSSQVECQPGDVFALLADARAHGSQLDDQTVPSLVAPAVSAF